MCAQQDEKPNVLVDYDDSDFDPSEGCCFIDEVMKSDDAHDPSLENYQSIACDHSAPSVLE